MAGRKRFYIQHNIGRAKYVVNYHDGVRTHRDGSPMYDVWIFHNQHKLTRFVLELWTKGYEERSN